MLTILYYCLKVIVCSGLLYGYYLLALRNNRFHHWNRFYLLASLVIAFTLPLLRIPILFGGDSPLVEYSYRILSGPDLYFTFIQKREHNFLTLPLLLLSAYALMSTFLLSIFIRNIIRIQRLKSSYSKEPINNVYLYRTTEASTPFSFFKNIFWNNDIQLNTVKGQQMLQHELTHVHQKHSIDKVAMELLVAVGWWNPFLHYIRKELSVIHEFLADQQASAGDAKLQYASLLLMKALGSEQYALGNPFFHSQLKRRLTMLTTINNPKFSYLRRLIALPLACVLTVLFAVQCERTHEDVNAKTLNALESAESPEVILDSAALNANNSQEASDDDFIKLGNSSIVYLPANALYIIDGNTSSKEEFKKLDVAKIKRVSILKGNDGLKKFGSKGANGVVVIFTQASEAGAISLNTITASTEAEEPAKFPGGIDGWRRYLEQNLKYPEAAQEKGTQGVVRMQMVVNNNGNIIDIKALNDPGEGLAAEAVRVLKAGPKWVPANQNGKPVTYKFVQTITFQLQ